MGKEEARAEEPEDPIGLCEKGVGEKECLALGTTTPVCSVRPRDTHLLRMFFQSSAGAERGLDPGVKLAEHDVAVATLGGRVVMNATG